MQHLVIRLEDGSASAIPVNGSSTLTVKTWRPPTHSEDGVSLPVLVEDQTFSLDGCVAVSLDTDAPADANVVAVGEPAASMSQGEADAFEAQLAATPAPWEAD